MLKLPFTAALTAVAFIAADAQRPMPPVPSGSVAVTRARAAALGIHIADSLADVPLPATGATTPQDIKDASAKTRDNLTNVIREANRHSGWLGVPLAIGNAIVEVGQWGGGAGAVYFGLQSKAADTQAGSQNAGRNASYAGALSFAVTFVKDVFHLDDAKKSKEACAELHGDAYGLIEQTYQWDGLANDPAFAATFFTPGGTLDKFNMTVESLTKSCFE